MSTTRNRFRGLTRLLSLAGPAAKGVITAGIIAISASPAEPAETGLRISIYVYNVAQVPQGLLRTYPKQMLKHQLLQESLRTYLMLEKRLFGKRQNTRSM
jgi:hypothetical protein